MIKVLEHPPLTNDVSDALGFYHCHTASAQD